MCRCQSVTAGVVLLLALTAGARPEENRPPEVAAMNAIILLPQPAVQKDLQMTAEQIQQVKQRLTSRLTVREELRDLDGTARASRVEELKRENDRRAATILTAEQVKRLRQLFLQQQGMNALLRPEIARAVQLTDSQRDQVAAMHKEAGTRIQALRNPATQENLKKIEELTRGFNAEALKLLTDEQKARWRQLTGEPFKGQLRLSMPGRWSGQKP